MNLYPVSQKMIALRQQLESTGGEGDERMISEYLQTCENYETALVEVGAGLREAIEAYGQLKEHAAKVLQRVEVGIEAQKSALLKSMLATGTKSIKSAEGYVQISVGSPVDHVEITDKGAIPPQYLKQPEPPPPSVDKRKIADALKAGEEVPGAHLQAGQAYLRIKTV